MKSSKTSLAPDCKLAPILAEHTVWEIQRDISYSDWHSRSEHVIKEMSKPAVPLVKALWRTIILSIFMIMSWLIINVVLSNGETRDYSILADV